VTHGGAEVLLHLGMLRGWHVSCDWPSEGLNQEIPAVTHTTIRLATALLFATTFATAFAAEPTSKQFVKDAVESNLAEIQASQLAVSKSANPEIKSFAQRMIDDHSRVNTELQQLAEQKGLKIPNSPDLTHQAALKTMQARSGTDFDKSYIEQMNKDHEKAIELFQAAGGPLLNNPASDSADRTRRLGILRTDTSSRRSSPHSRSS
jgi:predicted outer membrane protein